MTRHSSTPPNAATSEDALGAPSARQDQPSPQDAQQADDLQSVEAAINDAQRAAGSLAKGVDDASVAYVEGEMESAGALEAEEAAPAERATDAESGEALTEIVSALEEVERAQEERRAPASLAEYDKAIAGAVDDLLVGDFVSVDLVLEGMQETSPPPVVHVSPSDAASSDEQREGTSADDRAQASTSATGESAASIVAAAVRDVGKEGAAHASDVTTDLEGEFVGVEHLNDAAAPASMQPDEAADRNIEDVNAVPSHAPAAPQRTAESVARSSRQAPTSAEHGEHVTASKESQRSAADGPGTLAKVITLVGAMMSIALRMTPTLRRVGVAALAAMSMPLQYVPPAARDIVDWIALSLVFWVPIVWLYAIFIVG